MKKLITIFMCLNLILTPVAFAQGSGDQFREGSSAKKGGADFYANQILSLGTGIIGSTILTKCKFGPTQPSILLFMAGGLAYIAKEIVGGKSQGNFHQAKMADLKMVEERMKAGIVGGDVQKEVLDTALADEKTNLKFIKGRKAWMIAITTIFTAATVFAVLEQTMSFPPMLKPANAACTTNGGADTALLTKGLILAFSMGTGMAGGGAISQYGGMAIGLASKEIAKYTLFLTATTKAQDASVSAYSPAIGRAIAFGASAVLSGIVTAGLVKRQSIASSNIEKLERVVADFKAKTDTTEGIDPDADAKEDGESKKDEFQKGQIKQLPVGIVAKHCLSNSPLGIDYSEAGCKNKMNIPRPVFDTSINNATLREVGSLSTEMAQAVGNGDMEKADLLAGQIGAHAGRIAELKDTVSKQLNEKLKALGQKPIDLDKDIATQVASMQNDLNKAAAAEGVNLATSDKAELSEIAAVTPSVINTASAPSALQNPELNLGLSDSTSIEEMPIDSTSTASLSDSLEQYETNVQDISKKPEVSIFKQVSNRYILNYTKIFREKKKFVEEAPAQ